MGKAYKLQCKHCGTQFLHCGDSGYGVMPACIGCGESANSTRIIKCPGCQQRVNSSQQEFSEQVIEEISWE